MRRLKMLGLALVASAPLLAAGAAKADTINVFFQGVSGNTFTYYATLSSTGQLSNAGGVTDSFSIDGIQGFGVLTNSSVTTTVNGTPITFNGTSAPDGLGGTNVTFKYAGGTFSDANATGIGDTIATISFTDLFTAATGGATWTSQDHTRIATSTLAAGDAEQPSNGTVAAPGSAPLTGTPLPPAALGGVALFGLGGASKLISRRR